MTLDEAIARARAKALNDSACAREHLQLAGWLEELQRLRAERDKLRKQVNALAEANARYARRGTRSQQEP